MLKWKRASSGTLAQNTETLVPILAGMAGKNRVVKKASWTPTASNFFRVYRDAEQIVDFAANTFSGVVPILEMNLPLSEGQQCSTGFYNESTTDTAIEIMVGYDEAD